MHKKKIKSLNFFDETEINLKRTCQHNSKHRFLIHNLFGPQKQSIVRQLKVTLKLTPYHIIEQRKEKEKEKEKELEKGLERGWVKKLEMGWEKG